ncbi:MAG: prepilin-type N-terminal cleavage/methylation domain-containing protein [Cyanobium sp.]
MGRIVKRWPCTIRDRGFTMLELLAVVAVGGAALAATASSVVSQIRVTRTLHSSGQAQQDLSRLHRFLLAEI